MLWDTLRYADNKSDFRLDRLLNTGCGDRWGYEDRAGISSCLFYCIGHTREYWLAKMLCAGLLWVRASYDVRAILYRLLCMERAL